MALPQVNIKYENGLIGAISSSNEGILGLLANASPVADGLTLGEPYVIYSLIQLEDQLKVTVTNNPELHKTVKEFYNEAGNGVELWLMAFPSTLALADMLDKDTDNATKLIKATKGKISGLICSSAAADIHDASKLTANLQAAQNLAEWSTSELNAPLFVLLNFEDFDGNAISLEDLTEYEYNRAGVLVGDTITESKTAAIGLLGGRVAKNQVQRNIGAVRDGAINAIECYIGDQRAEFAQANLLHDKGYITFRTFAGKAGYYFNDDSLASNIRDDYRSLTNRRIADKAYRITYSVLIDNLLIEIPVNYDGTIVTPFIKGWEANVENAISVSMTARGELSTSGAGDSGCKCSIDTAQNVVQTGIVYVDLFLRPFGYARQIEVRLGFFIEN